MEVIVEEGCRTLRHSECQIPTDLACPPAPKKKKVGYVMKQWDPPKNEKPGSASLIGIKRMGKRLSQKKKEWESLIVIKPLYSAAK
ncbi:hypothetical protein SO802_030444 [Lithocarpus litseifolius]|uniref:Uncharacterized protein n=1 Tax=Lithocarpus litseifolius TaxID=425828 RepID=A0AAW2BIV5_9ROSI